MEKVRRSDQDLIKRGPRGVLCVMARKSFALSAKNEYAGTTLANLSPTSVKGTIFQLTKEEGKLLKTASDETIREVLIKAKPALADLQKSKTGEYTASVKEFINALHAMGGGVGGGGSNTDSLLGLTIDIPDSPKPKAAGK